jgi:hypothetical protein
MLQISQCGAKEMIFGYVSLLRSKRWRDLRSSMHILAMSKCEKKANGVCQAIGEKYIPLRRILFGLEAIVIAIHQIQLDFHVIRCGDSNEILTRCNAGAGHGSGLSD